MDAGASSEKQTAKKPRVGDGTPGPGRKKGVPNKHTTILKDALLLAAQIAGGEGKDGLVTYLASQAKENPQSFLPLLGKVLPLQISTDEPIKIEITRRIVGGAK